jgi:hypothetical protein
MSWRKVRVSRWSVCEIASTSSCVRAAAVLYM